MGVLEVGGPYIPGKAKIEPRAEFNCNAGQYELLLVFSKLTPDEIESVRTGDCEFALVVYGLVTLLLWRFAPAFGWSDSPFSIHLVPEAQRVLPPPPVAAETCASLSIVLVDADTNIVRALRVVSLAPKFSRALHVAITEQADGWFDRGEYDVQLCTMYAAWRTTDQLLDRAVVRTKGGA